MDDAGAQAPQLVTFPDHDTMLAYVFQKTSNGFRIQ